MTDKNITVGVVGASGYTGIELLRLLAVHPRVELRRITSRTEAGQPLAAVFPHLQGVLDLEFSAPDRDALAECDLVFFTTPNATAMEMVPALLEGGCRVIDLSADFRVRDAAVWAQWYGAEHACPDLLAKAVYGLPEINRDQLAGARLVANPGCYPTAVSLALLPLIEAGVVDTGRLIADAKSGVSGAGRKASLGIAFSEIDENFRAYGVSGHRHLPEISQTLAAVSETPPELTFVPHLVPMIRGIHATVYAELTAADTDVQALFEDRYSGEPFVQVMGPGSHPETRSVRGSNQCRLAVHRPGDGRRVVVLSVIDNLVKGAAGQAVQNMNLIHGWPETIGLDQQLPLVP